MDFRTNFIAPTFMPTQVVRPMSEDLKSKGAELAGVRDASHTVLRIVSDDRIDGKF